MARLTTIKRDKDIARLKSSPLVKRGGVYINYSYDDESSDLQVAIRVGRCHRKAVERNRIRRWVKEALRAWIKESGFTKSRFGLKLLVSVGVKDKEVDYAYIKKLLNELLTQIVEEYAQGTDKGN